MRKYVRKFLVNTKGMKVQLKLRDSFAKVPDCVLSVCVCVCVCLLNAFLSHYRESHSGRNWDLEFLYSKTVLSDFPSGNCKGAPGR